MVAMSDTSAGYAAGLVSDFARLDFEALGREAVDKCLRSRNPRALEPGEYTGHPGALRHARPGADDGLHRPWRHRAPRGPQLHVRQNRPAPGGSPYLYLGRRVGRGRHPLPFDFEGVPKERVDLLKDGIACGVVYDSYRAGKEGRASTGHALPIAEPLRAPSPEHVFLHRRGEPRGDDRRAPSAASMSRAFTTRAPSSPRRSWSRA
jgi:PmbA protein